MQPDVDGVRLALAQCLGKVRVTATNEGVSALHRPTTHRPWQTGARIIAISARSAKDPPICTHATRAPFIVSQLLDEPDAALISRCLQGEAAAWTALVHRYQRLVYAIARRTGLDDHAVADVFQTVFTRVIEHLPRIRQSERLHAWIVTTTKREALAQHRRAQRTVSLTSTSEDGDEQAEWDIADDAPLPEDALADLQQIDLLRHALDRLDDRCSELLKLLFRDEDDAVPYDEVARQLGMPVGSIGPTRARCLEKLRTLASGCISRV